MVAGKRQADRPKRTPSSRYVSDNRRAWVTVYGDELVLYRNEEPDEDTDSIKIASVRQGRKWVTDLTRLTAAELDAVKAIYLLAFQLAEPLVIERDRKAREDYDTGQGTQHRLYRNAPIAIGFEGDQREYVEGLLFRPTPVSQRLRERDGLDGGVRGAGDDVAPDEPLQGSAEDVSSETDVDQGVRQGDDWTGSTW